MKKVVLIGATGYVGSEILKELLSRGYEVTAVARSVDKIEIKDSKLKTVAANVTDTKAMINIIAGHDAVVSAFNAGWTNPNIYNDFLQGSKAIETATKEAGVDRYIVVGGGGSLYIDGKQIVDGADFPAEIKPGATAARDYLNLLKSESALDWTFLSPSLNLFPGERTGKYRIGHESPVFDEKGNSNISTADLAVAIVDELEKHQFSRQRFTAGY